MLVHPGLWDSRIWDPEFEAFAERFRAIRYDLRGYGRSSRVEGEFSSVIDLRALMTALDVPRAAVIGCSMGGRIAVDFTLGHPEMVDALVPVAAGLSGWEGAEGEAERWETLEAPIGEALKKGDVERAMDLALAIWAPLGTDDPAGRQIRQIARDNFQALSEVEELERSIDPPAAMRLGEIRVPTLVILGAQDVDDLNDMWKTMAPQIPGSRLEVIDQADHVVGTRQPKRFNDLVLAFLDESHSIDQG